jgi:hypothetical protein
MKLNTNQARQRSEHEAEEQQADQRHSEPAEQRTEAAEHPDQQHSGVEAAASRVEEWLTYSSHSYERTPEVLDSKPRHRDVVNPASTRIGHVEDEDSDLSERLRRLHAERDSRLQGNEDRRDRLDALRLTQAVCNSLDLTVWERDRVLGVVQRLDDTEFATSHDVERVALAVASRVVDAERRAWAGIDDQPPERIADLTEDLCLLSDSEQFQQLREETGLSSDEIDQLETAIERELDEHDALAAFGRSPYHDDALAAFE